MACISDSIEFNFAVPFKSQLLSQFQTFLKQTLCVFSQMKDIKHIRWDFQWVPWVMSKGLGLWGAGGSKI